MAQGPILIFDKSTLQALNPDQANWLDNFFMSNITPLFYIETLADLEKEVKAGKRLNRLSAKSLTRPLTCRAIRMSIT